MERKNFRIIDSAGVWVASPTITVYISGTVTLAAIFDDEGFTPKANPFVGPASGLVYFYAADGKYDVVATGGTPDITPGYTFGAVLLDDTLSLSSGGSGITSINGLTAFSQSLSTGSTGTDFAIVSAGNTHVFRLPTASNTVTGKLSAADWTTFNAKIGTLNGLTNVSQIFAIGSSGSSPSWSSSSGIHTLNLPTASAARTGILSAADWTTFNAKQNAIAAGTVADYFRGDLTFQPLTTSAVPEGARLYFTNARVIAAISATSPIAFSGAGVISIQVATGAQPGYLSAADWTTFNSKISSVATDATGTDFSATTAAGVATIHLPAASPTVTGGKVTNAAQTFSGPKTHTSQLITQAGRRGYVRYHTAPASVTVVGGLDDVIVINKTVAGATAVTLPAGPTTGDTYTIKDGKGDAAGNNITVSPSSGNIDGAASNVINSNYGFRVYIYNGVEWSVIGS